MRPLSLVTLLLFLGSACASETDLQFENPNEDEPRDTDDEVVTDGPQPDIKVDPEVLGFGYLMPGCAATPQTVTVSNVGDADLDIFDITPVGPGIGSYTYNGPTNDTLAPGDAITFEVEFSPATFTTYEGFIEIESNDPDEAITGVDMTGHGSESSRNEDIWVQPEPVGVDVLWVIDNSGSMSSVVSELGVQFDNFINTFVTLGLDYQLAVVTTDMVDPAHSGKFQGVGVMSPAILGSDTAVVDAFVAATNQGSAGSADERGADAAHAALTAPLVTGVNAGLIRTDANLSVIVVSDEDDSSSMSPSSFTSFIEAYKGDPDLASFSGVVGTDGGGLFPAFCDSMMSGISANAAPDYHDVIDGTGGHWANLCEVDGSAFPDMLTYLSYTAAGLNSAFPLSDLPQPVSSLQVTVDGVPVGMGTPSNGFEGWVYDYTDNTLTFSGSAIPGPNAVVVVSYAVEGGC